MKYNTIRKMDISNGPGVRVSVFTQGCNIQCKDCFNSNLWDITKGKEWTNKETNLILELLDNKYVEGITWLGGEPSIWSEDIIKINNLIWNMYHDKTIWLYTGHLINELPKRLINSVDVIVDGPFIKELKDINLAFRGSNNQQIYKIDKGNIINITHNYN